MLNFKKISLRRGARVLFSDTTFTIHKGQKAGLTGANGVGKSSLFAVLLGQLHIDDGGEFVSKSLSFTEGIIG